QRSWRRRGPRRMAFDHPDDWRADERDRHAVFPTQQGSTAALRLDDRNSNDAPGVAYAHNRQTRRYSARAFSLQITCELPADAAPRAQFERVVVPHLDEAYVLARALTGNSADAQDIVQDASLSAYRAIASYANGHA